MNTYPWYTIVQNDTTLEQGDFFVNCPVIVPEVDPETGALRVNEEAKLYNVVIMTQSCDLANGKADLVLVCPVWTLSYIESMSAIVRSSDGKETLRRGGMPGYHLLNECKEQGFEREFVVVDFRNVYSVPFRFLTDLANRSETRLRLLPPYREHLSQAFARFFMRVGLPIDIPSFKKGK